WAVKNRTKRYLDELKTLLVDIKRKREQLQQCLIITGAQANGDMLQDIMAKTDRFHSLAIHVEGLSDSATQPKPKKGETKRISLELFKSGKSIREIAAERSLTEGTVTKHLIHYIGSDIKAADLMDASK